MNFIFYIPAGSASDLAAEAFFIFAFLSKLT